MGHMIKLNTAKQVKKLMIATGVLSAIFLVGCNSGSQPSGKPLSQLTKADVVKIRDTMLSDSAPFVQYLAYPQCVERFNTLAKNQDDTAAKLDYSGKYKQDCESIFSKVKEALTKEGYAVTDKEIKNYKFATKMASYVGGYAPQSATK